MGRPKRLEPHQHWKGRNELAQEFYKTRFERLSKEKDIEINNVGDYTVALFNLSRNLNPKLPLFAGGEALGKEGIEAREVEKALDFKSSIGSGRYLASRNKQFIENYKEAIDKLAISEKLKNEFKDRIDDVPTNSIEVLTSILPNLNVWYENLDSKRKIECDDIANQIREALTDLGLYNE